MPDPSPAALDDFIARWSKSGGHERGSGQLFLSELCSLLELAPPDPPQDDTALNAYTFERRVDRKKPDGTTVANFIDLYKSGCFVLETKQGVNARRDKANPDQPLLELPIDAAAMKAAGQKPAITIAANTWPDTLSAQVAALQKLLPTLGPDPAVLGAAFGKRSKSRVTQISEILDTLRTLGKL
ncbi:MAG: type IIL restriction-modification enzyme MmeI [Chthoniobacteraceae bacterium]